MEKPRQSKIKKPKKSKGERRKPPVPTPSHLAAKLAADAALAAYRKSADPRQRLVRGVLGGRKTA